RTSTVDPGAGLPTTRSMAPEKIHGCRCRSDFSRPGFSTSAGTRLGIGIQARAAGSGDHNAKQPTERERDPSGNRAKAEHANAGKPGTASGEQRHRDADAE